MRDGAADACERQDRQRQLLSADNGSGGAGTETPESGKVCGGGSCRRSSPCRVRAGKEELQGVSVPQGYSALAFYPEYLTGEPSVPLADIGRWTVDLMRLDNATSNASTCRSLELGVMRWSSIFVTLPRNKFHCFVYLFSNGVIYPFDE